MYTCISFNLFIFCMVLKSSSRCWAENITITTINHQAWLLVISFRCPSCQSRDNSCRPPSARSLSSLESVLKKPQPALFMTSHNVEELKKKNRSWVRRVERVSACTVLNKVSSLSSFLHYCPEFIFSNRNEACVAFVYLLRWYNLFTSGPVRRLLMPCVNRNGQVTKNTCMHLSISLSFLPREKQKTKRWNTTWGKKQEKQQTIYIYIFFFSHICFPTIKAFLEHPPDSICSSTQSPIVLLPSCPTSPVSSLHLFTPPSKPRLATFPWVPSRAAVKRLLFVISAWLVAGQARGMVSAFSLASLMKREGLWGEQRAMQLHRCKEALLA